MNPILPREYFVPDAEARTMPDGRLYLYGSLDISGEKGFCSKQHRCFSTDDMINWRDEGIIISNVKDSNGFPKHPDTILFAPDAIYKNGKYYLFICCPGGFEGVAVSDSPCGPFSNATPIKGADSDGIDPAVFIDDDGIAYYFWGQFKLKGGILSDDMTEVVPSSITENLLTEWEHGFHEGASIRKRDGKYYLVYTDISRGKATCMSYAISDKPLGPYKKCGVIIDNIGCDPETWNNHGSIECYKGQWYVFYHRSSQNTFANRRVCVEPIFFDENGYIKEVQQTSNGIEKPIDAKTVIDASIASKLSQGAYIAPIDGNEKIIFDKTNHWCEKWAEYRFIDFGQGVSEITVSLKGKGKVTLICNNNILGSKEYNFSNYDHLSFSVKNISGINPIWLLIESEYTILDLFYFK